MSGELDRGSTLDVARIGERRGGRRRAELGEDAERRGFRDVGRGGGTDEAIEELDDAIATHLGSVEQQDARERAAAIARSGQLADQRRDGGGVRGPDERTELLDIAIRIREAIDDRSE
jgi:hypothetical protein